jgi:prepilin-type N-terminal cleavage/methylation domain-containing protein
LAKHVTPQRVFFREKGGLTTVIHYWFEKHRELQARRAEEGFDGFTLIELLIVIVVLGILAAVVVFALGGVTGQSKAAACNADAKSVEVAVEAYTAYPQNTTNTPPAAFTDLTAPSFTTQKFLRAAPTATVANNGYAVTLASGGIVSVTTHAGGPTDYDKGGIALCNAL